MFGPGGLTERYESFTYMPLYREDWDFEGQKMADYYANAYLTIAASRAESSHAGFLHLTDKRRLSTIYCKSKSKGFVHFMSKSKRFDCTVIEPDLRRGFSETTQNCEAWNPLYT
jgi:hypothetical protein